MTRNFQRVEVDDEDYLKNLILYIHFNPVKHGLDTDFVHYPYSSFKDFLTVTSSNIEKEDVLSWFNGIDEFLAGHLINEEEEQKGFSVPDDYQE